MPSGWREVFDELSPARCRPGKTVYYQKHMTHHLLPEVDRDALRALRHAFLIRDPRQLLASYARVRAKPVLADLGLGQQPEIFRLVGGPVIDATDLLDKPAADAGGAVRRARRAVRPGDAVLARRAAGHRRRVGPYWYEAVWKSTGFGPYRARRRPARRAGAAGREGHLFYEQSPHGPSPDRERSAAAVTRPTGAMTGRPWTRRESVMLQQFDERNRDLIVNVGGRLAHRDEAAISPFDSAVQGGDAVWEGLRVYNGRIFRLDEHLARLRRSAKALAFDSVPPDEQITERDPPHAAGQRDDRRRAHPAHADQGREDHQRHGPAAEPVRADADRAGRAQAAGLRHVRDHPDHLERAPAAAGQPRPEDPPQQPADLDPGQDRGQRRRRRRRPDARQPGLRRRDQRDQRVPGGRGRAGHALGGRLPGGDHPGRGARPCRRGRHRVRGRRLLADPVLRGRRAVRDRHHGRDRPGDRARRTGDRARRPRARSRPS